MITNKQGIQIMSIVFGIGIAVALAIVILSKAHQSQFDLSYSEKRLDDGRHLCMSAERKGTTLRYQNCGTESLRVTVDIQNSMTNEAEVLKPNKSKFIELASGGTIHLTAQDERSSQATLHLVLE
jgi:hypothetical protein